MGSGERDVKVGYYGWKVLIFKRFLMGLEGERQGDLFGVRGENWIVSGEV